MSEDILLEEVRERGYADFDAFIRANWDQVPDTKKEILTMLGFKLNNQEIKKEKKPIVVAQRIGSNSAVLHSLVIKHDAK